MRKYIAKPATSLPTQASDAMDAPSEAILSATAELDYDALLANCGEILRREIRSLMSESQKGKLSAPSARDLIAYLGLLEELRAAELKRLGELSDEELAKLAK